MAVSDTGVSEPHSGISIESSSGTRVYRLISWSIVAIMFLFLFNNYLNFWLGWPGVPTVLAHFGLFGLGPLSKPLPDTAVTLGLMQAGSYGLALLAVFAYVLSTKDIGLRRDAKRLASIAAFVVGAAFFSILFIGVADTIISFLRVEGFLPDLVGADLASALERPAFRGPYVHLPLIGAGVVMAMFFRGPSFAWLALLVVIAEFIIVITRFIFSYEQAFMGDLVRFWYAGLFLFASAYTLLEEGHVRVDVLYSGFSRRTRGFVNAFGSIFLGIALCWIILIVGLWGKSNIINSPLLTIEVTQQGFGLYVKYLMAGFLGVYAASMLVQFAGSFLDSIADIRGEPGGREIHSEITH